MFEKIRTAYTLTRQFLKDAARGYEPAVATQVAAASLTLLAGLGLTVAELSTRVDAVLAFLAVTAPLAAGVVTRTKVTPLAKSAGT